MKPNSVKKDVFRHDIVQALRSLHAGPKIIQGSLNIAPGHDYWWFLEYGTGPYHQDDDGELNTPAEVEGYEASGGPYDITVQDAKFLVYIGRGGVRRRAITTTHPGIKPFGFVRTAVFQAQIYLAKETNFLIRKNRLLDRERVVETVNAILEILLAQIVLHTPDDKDPDPFHEDRPHSPTLAQAWGIRKAK